MKRLRELGAREHLVRLVCEITELDATEQRIAFGESLPAGPRMLELSSVE